MLICFTHEEYYPKGARSDYIGTFENASECVEAFRNDYRGLEYLDIFDADLKEWYTLKRKPARVDKTGEIFFYVCPYYGQNVDELKADVGKFTIFGGVQRLVYEDLDNSYIMTLDGEKTSIKWHELGKLFRN